MYVISNVSDDFVKCRDEQAFKKLYCSLRLRQKECKNQKIFCIETEETVAGFPDVMELFTGSTFPIVTHFYEFKASDRYGNIEFQPTQPAFYKNNEDLKVLVVAYNRKSQRVHTFRANEIFNKNSPYHTTNRRINLCAVEKEAGVRRQEYEHKRNDERS